MEIVWFIDFFHALKWKDYQNNNLDLWNKTLNSNLFNILEKLYFHFHGQFLTVFEAQDPS